MNSKPHSTMLMVWYRWFVLQIHHRFQRHRGWFTAGQVGRELSISVVTAKKWLMELVEDSELEHKQEEGANGVKVHYFRNRRGRTDGDEIVS